MGKAHPEPEINRRAGGCVNAHLAHRAAYDEAGVTLCSACAGSYWLGHAGVLDGRPATTHWALEADFRASFPKVHLSPEQILLDDNDIVTAGGVMA